jgi:hypothetical protein
MNDSTLSNKHCRITRVVIELQTLPVYFHIIISGLQSCHCDAKIKITHTRSVQGLGIAEDEGKH